MLSPSDVDAALEEQQLHWTHEGDELTTTVKLHDFAAALDFVARWATQPRRPTTTPTSTSATTRCASC